MDKLTLTLPGNPVTKKNSQRILKNSKTGAAFVAPSSNYIYYRNCSIIHIKRLMRGYTMQPLSVPVNVCILYYMDTRRRVDLVNLQEASLDILVDAGILADDNSSIVASMDGSRVLYDKDNPRAEISITRTEV